jgi:hypothetical protein
MTRMVCPDASSFQTKHTDYLLLNLSLVDSLGEDDDDVWSAISWRDQATCQWDDDDVRFVLEQHV